MLIQCIKDLIAKGILMIFYAFIKVIERGGGVCMYMYKNT